MRYMGILIFDCGLIAECASDPSDLRATAGVVINDVSAIGRTTKFVKNITWRLKRSRGTSVGFLAAVEYDGLESIEVIKSHVAHYLDPFRRW